MTMDARDKETTSTYRPENAQQRSYRIVSNRIVWARENKKKSIVLSKCEGEEKSQWDGQVEMRRRRRRGAAMRCDAQCEVM